ncbi:hypothetical protein EDE05_11795 [Neorhizobium sp. R1-B]|nr:hypothetical protein EDE05_11795 [Neorhizobium sp. R1-B]
MLFLACWHGGEIRNPSSQADWKTKLAESSLCPSATALVTWFLVSALLAGKAGPSQMTLLPTAESNSNKVLSDRGKLKFCPSITMLAKSASSDALAGPFPKIMTEHNAIPKRRRARRTPFALRKIDFHAMQRGQLQPRGALGGQPPLLRKSRIESVEPPEFSSLSCSIVWGMQVEVLIVCAPGTERLIVRKCSSAHEQPAEHKSETPSRRPMLIVSEWRILATGLWPPATETSCFAGHQCNVSTRAKPIRRRWGERRMPSNGEAE